MLHSSKILTALNKLTKIEKDPEQRMNLLEFCVPQNVKDDFKFNNKVCFN